MEQSSGHCEACTGSDFTALLEPGITSTQSHETSASDLRLALALTITASERCAIAGICMANKSGAPPGDTSSHELLSTAFHGMV